jgi:IKI3 family
MNISCYHSILENKVNTICEKVRTVLIQREQKKYIQAILSTYVRSTPSDLESALRLLAELKGKYGQFLQRRLFFCAHSEMLILYSSSDGHWTC